MQQQSDAFAEGWEAARNRVTTALQSIYDKLLDSDGFIDVLNTFEKLINLTDKLIDGLGGLGGVLGTLGTLFTRVFEKQLTQALSTAGYNIQMMTKGGRAIYEQERSTFLDNAAITMATSGKDGKADLTMHEQEIKALRNNLALRDQLAQKANNLNDIEKQTLNSLIEQHEKIVQSIAAKQEAVATAKNNAEDAGQTYFNNVKKYQYNNAFAGISNYTSSDADINTIASAQKHNIDTAKELLQIRQDIEKIDLDDSNPSLEEDKKRLRELIEQYNKLSVVQTSVKKKGKTKVTVGTKSYYSYQSSGANDKENLANFRQEVTGALGRPDLIGSSKHLSSVSSYKDLTAAYDAYLQQKNTANDLTKEEAAEMERIKQLIDQAGQSQMKFSSLIVKTGQAFTSIYAIANSIKGIMNVINDDSASLGDKLLSISGSVGMLLPQVMMLIASLTALASQEAKNAFASGLFTAAQIIEGGTIDLNSAATGRNTVEKVENTAATEADGAAHSKSALQIKAFTNAITHNIGKLVK